MNVREAIKSVRDDYVEQFDAMVALQRAKRSDVFVERRMERPASNLFGKIYVPDVSFGDPMTEWLDMVPRQRGRCAAQLLTQLSQPCSRVRRSLVGRRATGPRRGVHRKARQLVVRSLDASGGTVNAASRGTERFYP
jgi:hypothetical protein